MKIKKLLLWVLVLVISVSLIMVFSSGGCRPAVSEGEEKPESEEALRLSEQPDKELFDKYFSYIDLGFPRSFFWGVGEENIRTLLPHQEGWLGVGFKNKKNFIFRIAVLNLETNDFIERCASTESSQGSDGFGMEALEWKFLRPGSYEYRIYVENTLVAALPFEVISYFKMPPVYILGFLLDIVLNPLVWALIIFWSIYAKTKKRWAKITATVFSCIAPLAILVSCFGNCIVTEILLGYWF